MWVDFLLASVLLQTTVHAMVLDPIKELINVYQCSVVAHVSTNNVQDRNFVTNFLASRVEMIPNNGTVLVFNSSYSASSAVMMNSALMNAYGQICFTSASAEMLLGIDVKLNKPVFKIILPWSQDASTFMEASMPLSTAVLYLHQHSQESFEVKIGCPDLEEIRTYKWTMDSTPPVARLTCEFILKGTNLIVGAYGFMPYVIFTLNDEGTAVTNINGTDIRVLEILASKLHFTFTTIVTTGWYTKFPQPDGSVAWDGSVGHLVNNTADIAVGDIMLMSDPFEVADFIFMYYTHCYYLTVQPGRLPSNYNLLKPYSTASWTALGSTLIGAMVVFGIMATVVKDKDDTRDFYTYSMFIFMSQFSQSIPGDKTQKRSSINILLFAWYCYCLIIQASYECNLRAFLMVVEMEPPIEGPKDILEQDRQFFLPIQVPNYALRYSLSPYKLERIVGEKLFREDTWYDLGELGRLSEAFEKEMIEKKHVAGWPGAAIQKAGYRETRRRHGYDPFRLSKATIGIFPSEVAMLLKKNSPITPLFHPIIEHLRGSGIINHITETYTYEWQPAPVDDELHALNTTHLLLGIMAFGVGCGLSVISFLCEIILKRKKKPSKK